ncbi:MAG: nicotinamide riboside transporter PnuC [Chitinophagales bacterium]
MENYLEYLAVATGVIYVLLASKNNIWCWLAGIISSTLYVYININHQLYQDAILQSYYIVAGFYGWWLWSKNNQEQNTGFISFSLKQNLRLIFIGGALTPVFGFAFSKLGNSLSYFDSAVTIFSFIATWMTAKKVHENWLYWIAIDLLAAVMYYLKNLQPTVILYIFFAAIALYGYFEWKKKMLQYEH